MSRRVIDWNDIFTHLNGELPNQYLQPTVYYTTASSDLDMVAFGVNSADLDLQPAQAAQSTIQILPESPSRLDVSITSTRSQCQTSAEPDRASCRLGSADENCSAAGYAGGDQSQSQVLATSLARSLSTGESCNAEGMCSSSNDAVVSRNAGVDETFSGTPTFIGLSDVSYAELHAHDSANSNELAFDPSWVDDVLRPNTPTEPEDPSPVPMVALPVTDQQVANGGLRNFGLNAQAEAFVPICNAHRDESS